MSIKAIHSILTSNATFAEPSIRSQNTLVVVVCIAKNVANMAVDGISHDGTDTEEYDIEKSNYCFLEEPSEPYQK